MKNIVCISALDGFDKDFPLGLHTWRKYCDRIGVEFCFMTERNRQISDDINGSWYPWFSPDLDDYHWDQALIVDADTMIKWDAPNIFDIAIAEVNVVLDSSPMNYGSIPHLNQWRYVSPVRMPPANYFNGGFVCLSKDAYRSICKEIPWYFTKAQQIGASSWEQTPINLLAWDNYGPDINYLSREWNDMIGFNYQDGDLRMINNSHVWHFTGPNMQSDKTRRQGLMQRVYDLVKMNY